MPTPNAVEQSHLRRWLGLAAFYAASFAVLAVFMQFFPVWLHEARGLSAAEVTLVLSGQTLARTLAGPLWSHCADRSGRPRTVLRGLAWASLAAFLLFGIVQQLWLLWLVAFVFGCLYPPMHPIIDALSMQQAQRSGFAYGRVRMVGSLSFLLVILLVGWWLERTAIGVVFGLLVLGLGATAGASTLLPRGEAAADAPAVRAPWWSLLRSGPFVLLLAAAALIQGSHATYYNLSTLHWNQHGIGKAAAGALWAEGITAEIVLFFLARGSFDRLRPTTLLVCGGLAATLRWLVLGMTTDVVMLAAFNWLHALSFALTFLGSLRALERRVPAHQRATAQGLLGAATSGIGMVTSSLIGGFVYDRWSGRAFFVMAAFALVGTGLAVMLRHNANRDHRPLQSSTSAPPA